MQHSKLLYAKGVIKNRKMLTQSQYEDYKFVCRMDHIKTFHSAIKAICFSDVSYFIGCTAYKLIFFITVRNASSQ